MSRVLRVVNTELNKQSLVRESNRFGIRRGMWWNENYTTVTPSSIQTLTNFLIPAPYFFLDERNHSKVTAKTHLQGATGPSQEILKLHRPLHKHDNM